MQNNLTFYLRRLATAGAFCAAVGIPVLSAQGQASGTRSGTQTGTSGTTRTTTTATNTGNVDREAREFVHEAAISGLKEVRLSRLALERASDPQVREFAQKMIDDHSKANAELASIARQQGINLPASVQLATTSTGAGTSTTARTSAGAGSDTATTESREPNRAGASGDRDTGIATGMGTSPADEADEDFAAKQMKVQDALEELSDKTGAEFDRAYVEQMKEDHEEAIDLFEKCAESDENTALVSFAEKTLPKLRSHLEHVNRLEDNLRE